MIVDIFIPCVHDGFLSSQRDCLLKILTRVGDDPSDITTPQCCGQHAHLSGYPKLAKTYGEKVLRTYTENRPIITVSTSCLGYMKKHYIDFFFNTSLHNELKQFQQNVYDITQYLVHIKKRSELGAKFEGKVAYYKSCVAAEKCGLSDEAENLLREVEHLQLVNYQSKNCCGGGGIFPSTHPEYAEKLALLELQDMVDAGAEYITSTDAHCLSHFKQVIEKHQFAIKTIHIVEILASGY